MQWSWSQPIHQLLFYSHHSIRLSRSLYSLNKILNYSLSVCTDVDLSWGHFPSLGLQEMPHLYPTQFPGEKNKSSGEKHFPE